MNRWFRMYDELLDDPKVQALPAEDFRGWVNLLCLANRNGGRLPAMEAVAFALRVDIIGARSLIDRLRIAGLIDAVKGGANGSTIAPHAWEKRQYKSDGSTERVKRYRERSRNATATLPVTPPEAETEAEVPLDKSNGAAPDSDTQFWNAAKAYLDGEAKDPGAMIGKWVSKHGKQETANALTRAQLERPVQKIPFIEGCFRHRAPEGGLSVPC